MGQRSDGEGIKRHRLSLSLSLSLEPGETEGDFQLRLFRSNPLSFSDGRPPRQNLLRQMEDQRKREREDEKKFAKMDGKKELRREKREGRASLSVCLSTLPPLCHSLALVCVPETWRIHPE